MDSNSSDEAYQEQILQHVSRTFALTIPQLPSALRISVANAYLLCRIADTIEDQTASSAAARLGLLHRFVAVLSGAEEAAQLARDLMPRLSEHTLPAELDLILNMGRIVRLTETLPAPQRTAIERCVRVMCDGMHQFQCVASLDGLARLVDLDDYCYYVAGVVGEMLTQLFCAHAPGIERQRAGLERLCVSFAQGLQMTNILKDVWEDRERGACWLPQETFSRHGVVLRAVQPGQQSPGFDAGMRELAGIAHAHLRDALSFTLLIPRDEVGIRRFCLWAIGMAVLTLRRIVHTPGFSAGAQVKISHTAVALTQLLSNAAVRHNGLLRRLFAVTAAGLPLARLDAYVPPGRRPPDEVRSATAADAVVSHAPQRDLRRGSSAR